MASIRGIFRAAIVGEWMLILVGLVGSFVGAGSLPPELSSYLSQEEAWRPVIDSLGLILLFASLAASAGLWFFKGWARPLYAGTTVALSLKSFFDGPSVEPPLAAALSELALIVAGFIIGVSYLGGLQGFNTPNNALQRDAQGVAMRSAARAPERGR